MHDHLTHENFLIYCAQRYNNPQCIDTAEFLEDLSRIKYIKKLITRYCLTNDLKHHLILNHIVVLNNVFGPHETAKILYLKLEAEYKYIKPFLIMLNICPDKLHNINTRKVIDLNTIEMDEYIVSILRKLQNTNEET